MSIRRIVLCAVLAAVAACAGCAGYFHYHPIKSTGQETMAASSGRMFPGEPLGQPGARGVSAAPLSEELLLK